MLGPIERIFVYLPFERSEDLTDQNESVRLFETLRGTLGAETIDYAHRHRDAIGLRSIPAPQRGAWPCQHVCGGGLSRRAGCRFLTVPHTKFGAPRKLRLKRRVSNFWTAMRRAFGFTRRVRQESAEGYGHDRPAPGTLISPATRKQRGTSC